MDQLIKILAIVFPVFATVAMCLLAALVRQIIRSLVLQIEIVSNTVKSVQHEITEHKEFCNRVDKAVLAKQIEMMEEEVARLRRFAHWTVTSFGRVAGKVGVELPEHQR